MTDMVNAPPHYRRHPSGIECVEVAERMQYSLGNAVKYLWRAEHKGRRTEDLQKALWFINRAIDFGEIVVCDDALLSVYAERIVGSVSTLDAQTAAILALIDAQLSGSDVHLVAAKTLVDEALLTFNPAHAPEPCHAH